MGTRQLQRTQHRYNQIIIAGESGGGNLTIATGLKLKQDGDIGLIKGSIHFVLI